MSFILRPSLKNCGGKVCSQIDEDGIVQAIFQDIQPRSHYFVEFGIGPNWQDPTYSHGLEGNCVLLRDQGWSGLFMDAGLHPEEYGIRCEFVTALNINGLLRKYSVPKSVDIVSIDVDGQDFWIWLALDYRPSLIIIEMNPNFRTLNESVTVVFDPNFRWDGTRYQGASLGALVKLGRDKGYKLVYTNGINAFFVRADLLANPGDFNDEDLVVNFDHLAPDNLERPWTVV